MKKLLFFIYLLSSFTSYSQEKRLALVIGNSAYEHGGVLKNAENDANLMASTLSDLGFDVIKRTNATKQVMESAILDFWRQLGSYDATLFYYAGHGIQANGINYLLPVDAKAEDELALAMEAVNVGEVVGQLERFPDNVNIVVLDACRDNPFRSWMRSGTGGFTPISAPSGTIIAYATSPGATASDGVGQYGLYTEILAQEMNRGQRIEDVFINTRNRVREVSSGRQNPQEWSQLTGSFFFKAIENDDPNLVDDHQQVEDNKSDLTGSANIPAEKLKLKELGRKKGLYLGNQKLRSREVATYLRTTNSPAYKTYYKYTQQVILGYGFSGVGAAFGFGTYIHYEVTDGYPEVAIVGMSLGIGMLITGLVFVIKATKTYESFIELYNPDGYTQLGLGPTENGFGLVLNF